MKNINNLLLATFLRKKVPYDSYIKQVRCKNSKEYPFYEKNVKRKIILPKDDVSSDIGSGNWQKK